MRNYLIIGGAILALYLLSRRRLATNVKVLFRGVSFTGGLKKPKLSLRFGIQNPTDRSAELRSLTGQVDANGRTIANVMAFQGVTVAPNSETAYYVNAEPAAVGIFQTVREYLRAENRQAQIKFTGTANVDGVNIPLSASASI